MLNLNTVSIKITRGSVKKANPAFFSKAVMEYFQHTDKNWRISEFRGSPVVLIDRRPSQATACYTIDPTTLKLDFFCHIGDKLTRI